VPLAARLEDQVARSSDHDVLAEQRADATLDDVAVFVLTRVPVERCRQRAADIGCSTSEKLPSESAPSIINRTPMLPRNPDLPSFGPNTLAATTKD
jgi:hypothetical protein